MTDALGSGSRSLAIRAERGISVFANTLVSRGLQEAGALGISRALGVAVSSPSTAPSR